MPLITTVEEALRVTEATDYAIGEMGYHRADEARAEAGEVLAREVRRTRDERHLAQQAFAAVRLCARLIEQAQQAREGA